MIGESWREKYTTGATNGPDLNYSRWLPERTSVSTHVYLQTADKARYYKLFSFS